MTVIDGKPDDKPVFKLFDDSKGPRKWYYYLPDQEGIMVRTKPPKHVVLHDRSLSRACVSGEPY